VFGEVGVTDVVEVKAVDAPDTRLRLALLGVTQASVEEESSAIIARKGSGGDFYRIGDVIEGRTRLAAVYKDKVILDTAGKLETLKFDDVSSSGIGVTSQVLERNELLATDDRAKSLRERFSRVRSAQDFMMVASEAAQQDPEEMLSGLGLESQGSGSGYKVTAGSILTQVVELKPGDIVLSVNGQPLGDASSDSSLLEQVMSEGSAQIEVQRGNSRFMVNQSFGLRN
jgi:general secretion pathway protein C